MVVSGRSLRGLLVEPSRSRPVNRAQRRHGDGLGGAWSGCVWLVWGAVRVVARFPRTSVTAAAGLLLVDGVGVTLSAVGVACLLAVAGVWRVRWPGSFRRLVSVRVRGWRRRWFRYAPRWAHLMARSGLLVNDGDTVVWPGLRRVVSSRYADGLLVKLRHGQTPEDVEAVTEQLGHAVGSADVRVRVHRPGLVWVEVMTRDPLREPIPALPVPSLPVDLSALPIGRREDGARWLLELLGRHVFIAGAMGSGKGSVIWSTLRALAPAIRAGLVVVWAIDPKGGMELFPGRSMFVRYEDDSVLGMVELLEDAADFTRDRAKRLKGVTRKLTPSVADPFVLVLVDEFAFITAYLTDKNLQRRSDNAVQIITSQGRAPGVAMMAALQDPSKEVVPYRNLFPTRIALRLDESQQTDMVLGENARARGAYCDRISSSMPGTAYIKLDGVREPMRVRASYPTDTDIDAMARDYPAPTTAVDLATLRPRTASGLEVAAAVPDYLADDELSPEWQEFAAGYQKRHANGTGKTL